MFFVLGLLKRDHVALFIPASPDQFLKLAHLDPASTPLAEIVVDLIACARLATVLSHISCYRVKVHLLEALVCSNTTFNQLAHTTQDKGRHCTSPAHSTPRALLSTNLHLLTPPT